MRMTAEELPDALITDSASREAFADAPAEADATGATEATLEEAVETACALVPPIWPLRHFVAVNAYLGWSDRPLFEAAEEIDRLYHADALMPEGPPPDSDEAAREAAAEAVPEGEDQDFEIELPEGAAIGGVVRGITIMALMPRWCAPSATPWA